MWRTDGASRKDGFPVRPQDVELTIAFYGDALPPARRSQGKPHDILSAHAGSDVTASERQKRGRR